MLLMYWKKCWSGIVRNLVLSMFPVTTTKSMKINLLKNMPPQTTTDTTFILTSVRFPGSFSDLNSRHTIGCQRNTSQTIEVIYEIFNVKRKYVSPWTFVLSRLI